MLRSNLKTFRLCCAEKDLAVTCDLRPYWTWQDVKDAENSEVAFRKLTVESHQFFIGSQDALVPNWNQQFCLSVGVSWAARPIYSTVLLAGGRSAEVSSQEAESKQRPFLMGTLDRKHSVVFTTARHCYAPKSPD
eukprot:s247_g8.t1